jgi:hypothetical protein
MLSNLYCISDVEYCQILMKKSIHDDPCCDILGEPSGNCTNINFDCVLKRHSDCVGTCCSWYYFFIILLIFFEGIMVEVIVMPNKNAQIG